MDRPRIYKHDVVMLIDEFECLFPLLEVVIRVEIEAGYQKGYTLQRRNIEIVPEPSRSVTPAPPGTPVA